MGLKLFVLFIRAIRQAMARPGLTTGCLIVLAFASVAIAAPLIAPPEESDPYRIPASGFSVPPQAPDAQHPLGTMQGQYDVFYGLIWGTRVAFRLGLVITIGRALIGVLLGLVSGYYGGLVDALIMRLTDAFLAFPIMAAALLTTAVLGNTSLGMFLLRDVADSVVILPLTLFGWMQYTRLIRGNLVAEREKEYAQAARSVGSPNRRIIFRHLLPNSIAGLFVLFASDIGAMVVLASVFSFIGFGPSVVKADWGQMLSLARNWIIGTPATAFLYWYTYVPPSLAIVLFSIGWNLIGDGLRDALDPRLRYVQ